MVDEVRVSGAEDLVQLGKTLKALGDKTILPTLRRELNADTKEQRRKIRDRIRTGSGLPQRGGLAKWLAGTPATSTHVERDRASIKLKLSKRGHDIAAANRGRLRHPVFGRRPWVTQDIASGWWESAAEPEVEELARKVADAVDRAVQRAVEQYKSGGDGL